MILGDEKYLSRHAKHVLKTLHKGYSKKLRTNPNERYEPTAEFVKNQVRRSDAEFKKILAELSPKGLVSHWTRNLNIEGRNVSRGEPTLRIEEEGIAAAERLKAQRRGWAKFALGMVAAIVTTVVSTWIVGTFIQKSTENKPQRPPVSQSPTDTDSSDASVKSGQP